MAQHDEITDWDVSSNVPPPGEPADPDATRAPTGSPAPPDQSPAPASGEEGSAEPARDELGKFRRRHRARSQQAGPEDVPRIQALTKKNRELQEQLEKFQKPALPLSEPAKAPPAAVPQQPPQAVPPSPVQAPQQPQRQGIPQSFPEFQEWLAFQGNENKTFNEYSDARNDWRWMVNAQAQQQMNIMQGIAQERWRRYQAFEQAKVGARTKYPDYDDLTGKGPDLSAVMAEAILATDRPAEICYYLAQHPDLSAEIAKETWNDQPWAYGPTKRLLESYVPVAAATSPSSPAPAADRRTGSALALAPTPPKPPNPVRTQAPVSSGDEPPGDDASLEDHERFFHKGGRRRR